MSNRDEKKFKILRMPRHKFARRVANGEFHVGMEAKGSNASFVNVDRNVPFPPKSTVKGFTEEDINIIIEELDLDSDEDGVIKGW